MLCDFVDVFVSHVMIYFDDVLLFTDSEYEARDAELILNIFFNDVCYDFIVLALKSLLSFFARFVDVQDDHELNLLCSDSLLFLMLV